MQDLAAGMVRNEGRHGVFPFFGASPKPVLLGETAVHRDLPRILGLDLKAARSSQ